MWGCRRPQPGDGLIALALLIIINLAALPILGLAGIMSDKEDEKVMGYIKLIAGIVVWGYILLNMGN